MSVTQRQASLTIAEYLVLRRRTSPNNDQNKLASLRMEDFVQLIHGSFGITTESGELTDALKRAIFYGKELDKVNVAEEIGDLLWYIGEIVDALQLDMGAILARNIEKLRIRYPEKFTGESALNRDTAAERAVLERVE